MIRLLVTILFFLLEFKVLALGIARPISRNDLKSTCTQIPSRLFFNYKVNLVNVSGPLKTSEQLLADNVARSIGMFPDVQDVQFGDDSACVAMIKKAHSQQLADFFTEEHDGRYKSDLCRLAQLYLHGGYYLDNDLEPISDVRAEIPPCTSLVSVASSQSGIFQAFLGASIRHPAIELAMNLTLQHYLHKLKDAPVGPLGTGIMELALRQFTGMEKMLSGSSPSNVLLFEERRAEPGRFRSEPMERYDACNYGVWYSGKQLFYSRAIGRWSGRSCKRIERWSYVMPSPLRGLGTLLEFISNRF